MAKTPRSRNADDKVIQGKELDAYIKAELQAMVQEGLEIQGQIQIVKGGISTLTSRKIIINNYRLRQHNNYEDGKRELTTDEKAKLAMGRTGAAYISKANRLDAEIIALKAKYERNVLALADIIEYIDNATPIKVEDMLADDLIRELAERKRNSRMS